MRSLRGVGVLLSLLIVGVLGGLVAPLPSGAVNATTPTIEITVESMSGSTILDTGVGTFTLGSGLNAPTATSCPAGGPNYCYPLVTFESNSTKGTVGPANRQFKVMHAPNQTAKLNISDYKTISNTNPSDTMVLTGVQFVPIVTAAGWPTTAKVRLTVRVRNKFDAQPNPPANGSTSFYPFGMTVGGFFGSSPSPIGDISQIYGKGTLVTAGVGTVSTAGQPKSIYNNNTNYDADLAVNSSGCTEGNTAKSPLCKTVASPGLTAQLTFTAGQNSTYYPGSPSSTPASQQFACTNNAAAGSKSVVDPKGANISYSDPSCQPDITKFHVFTLFGPDSVVLSGSSHSGGGVCGPKPLPACDCDDRGKDNVCKSINAFLAKHNQDEKDLQGGIEASVPCSTDICNGTLRTLIRVTPAPASTPPGNNEFPFIGAGPRIDNFEIPTDANGNGELLPPFANLITGRGGTALIISAGDFPPKDANSFWQVDQINCASSNGSTIPDVDFNTGPGGPNKGPLTVHAIGNGDTLTCLWHIHNEQNPK